MPNGDDEPKNWTRLHILLDAFHQRYGHWPDYLKLGRQAREEIRRYLGPALYARLVDRLESLPDDDAPEWLPILVRDRTGLEMEYGSVADADPGRARLWLGIDPHVLPPRRHAPPEESRLEWDVATTPEVLNEKTRAVRASLADAARGGNWKRVLATIRENPAWVNAARPGGSSAFTPLHQAAYNGAPPHVVEALLDAGAWRLLRAASGELPVDIAAKRGHRQLLELLTPRPTAPVDPEELRVMEVYLHASVNARFGDLEQFSPQ